MKRKGLEGLVVGMGVGMYTNFGFTFELLCYNFQLNFSLTSPSIDPRKATMLTSKQRALNVLSKTPLVVQTSIFFWTMYISTGKYMAKGQKLKVPSTPST
uniref:Uncharacterized protein n=1 Tax=Opuntia streptacantha TaxID=393608 RepID=A0A7C8YXM1_OPUST